LPALTFAATIDRVLNGLTRPFFGWISDHLGRENTMLLAFGIEGIGIYYLYLWGSDPFWFVLLSGLVFFAWGEIYSLFPATATDTLAPSLRPPMQGCSIPPRGQPRSSCLMRIKSMPRQVSGTWCSSWQPAQTSSRPCSRSVPSSHGGRGSSVGPLINLRPV
jgi:MFS transporter, OFA family, oxalate/formate antiporter